jgi:hypothetical protein
MGEDMALREAEKAGSWYTSNSEALADELESYLVKGRKEFYSLGANAIIVPHAGLTFSGPVAGLAYAAMEGFNPETIIVFGAVHTMYLDSPVVWAKGAWQTPLGDVEVDEELASLLLESETFDEGEQPHYGDNAIELQMPFIKHCFPEAKVVPIATPPAEDIEKAGSELADITKNYSKKITVVGSTDFTHYGRAFGITPAGFGQPALDWAKENDMELINHILNFECEKIVPTASQNHSACGAGAIAATTMYAKSTGLTAKLLQYTNSHEIMPEGEAQHFVGYASIAFSE